MTAAHATGFVAGCIGLVPATMRLEDGTAAQTRRALANCEAVRRRALDHTARAPRALAVAC